MEWVRVPAADAGEQEIIEFAHTYDGYGLHTGQPGLAQRVHDEWERTGDPGDDLDVLRACLFFEVRAHRHSGGRGRFAQQPFAAALLARIRVLAGPTVPVHTPGAG
ncbi:hypothetical protein AB0G04_34065 [Actinoplanes sp. NPDC023801]|uniref:hypothetical protein n=1 Tax=Actinoplanes sp. NPDC023801 TaxID=3154595 RepID=UPI0033C17305